MKGLRILSIILLFFVGVNGIAGGALLMLEPRGSLIQLPFHYLDHTPFHNYFIPGLILLLSNGVMSILVAMAVTRRRSDYPRLIFLQGSVILGWIATQMIMIRLVFWLHFVIGGIGVLLVCSGVILNSAKKK